MNLVKSFLISVGLTVLLVYKYYFHLYEIPRVALLFATIFAAFSNADYIWSTLRGKYDQWGSPLAHVGFAFTIFGAVISTAKQDFISQNQIGDISSLNNELNNNTDLLLMQGDTLQMGEYFVSYKDRRTEGIHVFFDMDYYELKQHNYNKGDIVVLISSSGESQNMINAAKLVKKKRIKLITFTGFSSSNKLKKLGDINFWVDSKVYNHIENIHQFWLLMLSDLAAKKK